jgi:glycosyltransferase involved in cell wall biosynthesis
MITVSVIIPTFDRQASLLRLLSSINQQSMDPEKYEVIVVDDGSPNFQLAEHKQDYIFPLKILRQENQGATISRNSGAQRSRGAILVFIDDDVSISPDTLESLAESCLGRNKIIALGSLESRSEEMDSKYAQMVASLSGDRAGKNNPSEEKATYVDCNTQVLAIHRQDFFDLGMLQDPTGGWPNWDDVDLGYRAYKVGFRFVRVNAAKGIHWDNSLASLERACQRWFNASKSAVLLFQKYPDLKQSLPMFEDKSPIRWQSDDLNLIVKKITRSIASTRLVMSSLQGVTRLLEILFPQPDVLRTCYRWISGGYMFKGYRCGLREYGPVNEPGNSMRAELVE